MLYRSVGRLDSFMTNILHITADYPDVIAPGKTRAVKSLLDSSPGFNHLVYSMNRATGLGGIEKHPDESDNVISFRYKAPPLGLLQETFLNPVADWIYEDLQRREVHIDVIHAHKLTIEGVIALRLSEKLQCPFVSSLWGNTDQKYIRAKPEKKSLYREVATKAAQLLPAAPWIQEYVIKRLNLETGNFTDLPVITESDTYLQSQVSGAGLVSAYNLDIYRTKGTVKLLDAISMVVKEGEDIQLTIFGRGSEKSIAAVNSLIAKNKLQEHVKLGGVVPHENIQETFSQYQAFVLPTLTESYGMVYIEALFSGVPVLYSGGRGVDGFFDDVEIGYKCDPKSTRDIAHGLTCLISIEEKLKSNISELQHNGFFEKFRKHSVVQTYSELINKVLS